jgi:predicted transcriptional regulator
MSFYHLPKTDEKFGSFREYTKMNTPLDFKLRPKIVGWINLSEQENKVIEALISLNYASSVLKIAKTANVPRMTADYVLKKFLKSNIVRRVQRGKRYKYVFNPQKYRRPTRKQLKEMREHLLQKTPDQKTLHISEKIA